MEERSRDYLRDILAKIKTAVRRARKRPRSLFYYVGNIAFDTFIYFKESPWRRVDPCGRHVETQPVVVYTGP